MPRIENPEIKTVHGYLEIAHFIPISPCSKDDAKGEKMGVCFAVGITYTYCARLYRYADNVN